MIVIEPLPNAANAPRQRLNRRDLQRFLVEAKKAIPLSGVVSVLLTGDEAVRELNHRFRNKKSATDVISFPAAKNDGMTSPHRQLAGDLAVSIDAAARQAEHFGHSLNAEIKILMLHGLLHLAGLDHETDTGEMAATEQKLRKQLELPVGLINRSLRKAVSAKRASPATSSRQPAPSTRAASSTRGGKPL